MSPILFYLLSALSIVSAFVMVSRRHPLPAATALVLCFVGLAGLFALLQAPLLAVLQILVYAGAIMALVVFVIMLLNVRDEDLPAEPHLERNLTIALLVMVPFFVILYASIKRLPMMGLGPDLAPDWGGIASVGLRLYNTFGFQFEIISLLLTVAVVGVVVLAKRRI